MSKTTIDREVLLSVKEALKWGAGYDKRSKAIAAIREALKTNSETVSAMAQQQEPWCMKINGCKTKCEDCPDETAQPQQGPVALPCCGYTNAGAIKWNPFNGVVQCHNCGQTYTPPAQPAPVQEPVAWRYADARGHYRYRGYVPNFDVEYKMLKPEPLYTTQPAAQRQHPSWRAIAAATC